MKIRIAFSPEEAGLAEKVLHAIQSVARFSKVKRPKEDAEYQHIYVETPKQGKPRT